MGDTYTANTGQILQTDTSNRGIWGDKTNTNWLINSLLNGGNSSKSFTNADITVVNVNGVADDGKNVIYTCSGTLTGNVNLILPTVGRQFIVVNNCTGAFTLTAKTVAGSGIVIPQTAIMPVYCDGTNILPGINITGLGLGTMSAQNANSVTITGGSVVGTTLDNGAIGATTPCVAQVHRPIVSVTGTTKTLVLTDADTFQLCSNASSQTITVPTNSSVAFQIGTELDFFAQGAGQVIFVAAGGVTIESKSGNLKLTGQFSGGTLKLLSTNVWSLVGDLSA